MDMCDDDHRTALMEACENNHMEAVLYLLRAGADAKHRVKEIVCLERQLWFQTEDDVSLKLLDVSDRLVSLLSPLVFKPGPPPAVS